MNSKSIYFIAGLPRSGSTLLANILAQHPECYVTPTSGIINMLVNVRNHWDQNEAFRAMEHSQSEKIKLNVMRAMLEAYFEHTEKRICIDKNRYWCEFLEMAEMLLGGREKIKILITVRDLRDIVSSFELLYRKTSALGQLPQETSMALKFKTALGRAEVFVDDSQPIGSAYNALRDAVTRGWLERMHLVDYDQLTRNPKETLKEIYDFLEEPSHDHNFDQVQQTTIEDDSVYGFKDLHVIRPRVEPQEHHWNKVYDGAVLASDTWKSIEELAEFWKPWRANKDC